MQEDAYISARLHRHSGLAARRQRLQPVNGSRTSQATLCDAVRARLFYAIIRRGLQMELLESTPPGLELMSLQGSSHSAMTMSLTGDFLECDIVLPQQVLLPLLDELLSSYDHFRLALWPQADAVLQRLHLPGQPQAATAPPVRRVAEARAALVDIVPALQQVVVESVLRHLQPSMLINWRLHLAETQVCASHHPWLASTSQLYVHWVHVLAGCPHDSVHACAAFAGECYVGCAR